MTAFPPNALGLALSGGGSRAAAFHRGVVRALIDLALVKRVDVISTVSGGSLFGGAWMAARQQGTRDDEFLTRMRAELAKGFIGRSVRPALIKALLPFTDYSRTDLLAETFDRVLFSGSTLSQLPERPALCLNVALLNNGQVGKFSRDGFSAWDIVAHTGTPGASAPSRRSHVVPWGDFKLARAVAASAAFPVGLPPVVLSQEEFPAGAEFQGTLAGAKRIALTDGGVLENLGVQTLLRSRHFGAWDLIVSDAGTRDRQWSASAWAALKGLGIWALSGQILDRLMLVMNDKQNRWARQEILDELEHSWMAEELRTGRPPSPALAEFLKSFDRPNRPRRKLLFIRVNQTWSSFLQSISRHQLVELGHRAGLDPALVPSQDAKALDRQRFLENVGVNLSQAFDINQRVDGDPNEVETNFTGLGDASLDLLEDHAAWQVHAAHAIYGL